MSLPVSCEHELVSPDLEDLSGTRSLRCSSWKSRSAIVVTTIEVASVIELSEASDRVAAGLFIYPPTIDTLVTGMTQHDNLCVDHWLFVFIV